MALGFFVMAGHSENGEARFASSFVADTLWDCDGEDKKIDVEGPGWHAVCLGDRGAACCRAWTEDEVPEYAGSFVYTLGWCYRMSSANNELTALDYREMLRRLRAGMPPASEDYSGNFAVVVFDAQRKRLAVQPDRMAIAGVFFAIRNGEVAVSNRALRVASFCEVPLDGHSILSMMRGTHIPFGRTLFAGVRRLMGATYLEVDLESAEATVKKPYSLYVPTRQISYPDAVELYAERVKSTVKRLLAAESAWFDLTGGNDTRVLASGIEHLTRGNGNHGYAFRVVDPEGAPDVRVARQISETCGWPLTRLDRYASGYAPPEQLQRAATSADGNFPLNYIWERIELERAYSTPGQWKAHVGAAAGEIFRGFFYAHEMLNMGRTSRVNYDSLLAFRTYASRGVNLELFGGKAPTFAEHDEVLLAPYRAIGDEGGDMTNTYKLDQMYVQRHCYRSGNGFSWLLGFCNPCLPFLTWELGGMGLSLPWKYRANRELAQRVIGKLSPKLAEIPNVNGEPMKPLSLATLPGYVRSKMPIALNRAGRVARKLMGRSGEIKRSNLPVPLAGYFTVLENAKFLPGMFELSELKRIYAEAQSDETSRDVLMTFYTLCTVELLLQQARHLKREFVFA